MHSNPYCEREISHALYDIFTGRQALRDQFRQHLNEPQVVKNLLLAGAIGVGKSALLNTVWRRDAMDAGWLWANCDVSDVPVVRLEYMVQRLFADLNIYSGGWQYKPIQNQPLGAVGSNPEFLLDQQTVLRIFVAAGGSHYEKLKRVLLTIWEAMQNQAPQYKGIVFVWDSAHHFAKTCKDRESPLGILLDVFREVQREGVEFRLVLAGLPTMPSVLKDAREFAASIFQQWSLEELSARETQQMIMRPLRDAPTNIHQRFAQSCDAIYRATNGNPHFISYWCWEMYEYFANAGEDVNTESLIARIQYKFDVAFFGSRWAKLTERQCELLRVVAQMNLPDRQFSLRELVNVAKESGKTFSSSYINQLLSELFSRGLIYRVGHGTYSIAAPALIPYIQRQSEGLG